MDNNVRRIRRAIDMTQQELANKIGSHRTYIVELEKGRIAWPSIWRCYDIARALGHDVQEVFPPK